MNNYPRLILYKDFDERAEYEVALKGWLNVLVETERGVYYSIHFMDPIRLQQEMVALTKQGEPCLVEPNLVVVPEVTVDTVQKAFLFLVKKDFFEFWKPVDSIDQSIWNL